MTQEIKELPEWEVDGGVWRSDFGGGKSAQVYPVDDLKEHVVDGGKCWCDPEYDATYDVVIHNSMDQREKFETGKRKPS